MLIDRAMIKAALPHYELGDQIGSGGYGLVFAARHRQLALVRAVKAMVLADSDLGGQSGRFLTEAQVMTELDHPHIMRVHEYAEHESVRLLVMEHLPGGTLSDRLTQPVEPAVACAWGLAVADALQSAHDRGVIHRDIKPDNLLFTATGVLKVSDFGIAKLFEGTAASGSLEMLGTPLFIAPEQITGGRIRPATDLYPLGLTLYQLLSGRTPFPAGLNSLALLHHHLDKAPEPLDELPPRLAELVLQALEKDPADRPSSARAFALALAGAATQALGDGWLRKSGVPLRIAPDIQEAAAAPPPLGEALSRAATTVGKRPGPPIGAPAFRELPTNRIGPELPPISPPVSPKVSPPGPVPAPPSPVRTESRKTPESGPPAVGGPPPLPPAALDKTPGPSRRRRRALMVAVVALALIAAATVALTVLPTRRDTVNASVLPPSASATSTSSHIATPRVSSTPRATSTPSTAATPSTHRATGNTAAAAAVTPGPRKSVGSPTPALAAAPHQERSCTVPSGSATCTIPTPLAANLGKSLHMTSSNTRGSVTHLLTVWESTTNQVIYSEEFAADASVWVSKVKTQYLASIKCFAGSRAVSCGGYVLWIANW